MTRIHVEPADLDACAWIRDHDLDPNEYCPWADIGHDGSVTLHRAIIDGQVHFNVALGDVVTEPVVITHPKRPFPRNRPTMIAARRREVIDALVPWLDEAFHAGLTPKEALEQVHAMVLEAIEHHGGTPDRRDPTCVERWPDCAGGEYNPACCRFPKSCSCETWEPTLLTHLRSAEADR